MTPPLAPPSTGQSIRAAETLAFVLIDWRGECERRLRMLTTVQRYLEQIRSASTGAGERALLVQEMDRLLCGACDSIDQWHQAARDLVGGLQET